MEIERIEELTVGEELEVVEKLFSRTNATCPLVNVGEKTFYFNQLATDVVPEYIKWFTTNDYIIGLPTTEKDKNGYKTWKANSATLACFPIKLRSAKKLKQGLYKVYKYKEGFAFKRYEQYSKEV